jgi:hypothetical protein
VSTVPSEHRNVIYGQHKEFRNQDLSESELSSKDVSYKERGWRTAKLMMRERELEGRVVTSMHNLVQSNAAFLLLESQLEEGIEEIQKRDDVCIRFLEPCSILR